MNDLLKLISVGENEGLEFKESLRLKEEIGQAVSAFSNARGGSILVGVSNDGKVIGVDIGRNTLEELANYVKRNTDQAIFPSVKILDAEGKKIIVIEVKESAEKPVFFKNHAYKRVGKTNQQVSSSEMRKSAKESGAEVYWDEQVCEAATLEDIDEEKVRPFLRRARFERRLEVSPNISVREALERLNLIKNKIVKWCLEHGLREPDFEEIAGGFLVRFYAPEDILSLIPEPGKIDLDKLGLNERQIKALGLMVNEGKVFTNKEYREHFGVSNWTCVDDMKLLEKHGLVIVEGKGKSTVYRASESPHESKKKLTKKLMVGEKRLEKRYLE